MDSIVRAIKAQGAGVVEPRGRRIFTACPKPTTSWLQLAFLPAGVRRTLVLAERTLPGGHYLMQVRDRRGAGSERIVILR